MAVHLFCQTEGTVALLDSSILSSEDRRRVREALENDHYVWRTIDGITHDTGLPRATVENAVQWDDELDAIVASYPDNKGRTLYTTRRHYQKMRPLGWRVLGAIAGKTA
jgi:hypothetical protein